MWWVLAAGALAGAVTVVFSRDVLRMALGLGGFLVALAGFYMYYALPFLATVQVFVYVGGVLVLILFGIMLVHRSEGDARPGLSSRHDPGSAAVAVGILALVTSMLWPLRDVMTERPASAGTKAIADLLLGDLLPHFEAAGALLLIALVAVIVIAGGDDR